MSTAFDSDVNGRTVEAQRYLIATGSVPWVPPIAGLGEVPYLTSTSAMDLQEVPESLIVVGGNYIGLELECGMDVQQLANTWCPYLTISEGINLAAQAFTMNAATLSCCGGESVPPRLNGSRSRRDAPRLASIAARFRSDGTAKRHSNFSSEPAIWNQLHRRCHAEAGGRVVDLV